MISCSARWSPTRRSGRSIATKSLNAGAGYDELKNVVIVMIMPYDPFGLDRMVYTVKSRCLEVPEMEYEDGAGTLFLYTKGTQGVPNKTLQQLLRYMENTTRENAVNEELRKIHKMVETVKKDPEVTAGYMLRYIRDMERMNRIMAEGKALGMAEGRAEGIAEGDLYRVLSLICKKLRKNKTLEEIAADLEEEVSVIEPLYNKAKESAPDYSPDLVFEQMHADGQT